MTIAATKQPAASSAATARLRHLLSQPHNTVFIRDVVALLESGEVCNYAIIGIWAEMKSALRRSKTMPPGTKAILAVLEEKAETLMHKHLHGE